MALSSSGLASKLDAVVIGASAGGIEALSKILPGLPATFPLPIAVVLHLAADRPSLLTTIFAPKCQLAVSEAEDKDRLSAGGIYFAPPDYHLLLETAGSLALSVDPPRHFSRPSIDVLFESAADCLHQRVLAILLTGASSDGAEGLKTLAAAGGLTIMQDPTEAYAPQMPRAALRLQEPSAVLSSLEIAAFLRTLGEFRESGV
jgi:two-component system chemotaxis response regulator CheB